METVSTPWDICNGPFQSMVFLFCVQFFVRLAKGTLAVIPRVNTIPSYDFQVMKYGVECDHSDLIFVNVVFCACCT